jgi:DNA-binding NarL/FixJ family response regulator
MTSAIIIDDQATFRLHLRKLLIFAGMDVIAEAEDIPTAEMLLRSLEPKPEIAVVDVMLPGINGVEGTRRLKKLIPSLRVYLVSAHHDQAQVLQGSAIEVGAEGFIAKDDLDLAVVQRWKQP